MATNRYQLTQLLGRGGMAEVYEAVQRSEGAFSRRVAIKRMLPGAAADPVLQRSFLDEASIASRLHHASIIAVLDFGTIDGQPFQVLELVVGLDARALSARVRKSEGQFSEALALYICREVAHALHYAHTATDRERPLGIVHRDVKPSNILVSTSGDVKLGDFGIAFAHERSERTEAGVVKGTMSFMAPEQLLGTAKVDARADVFALGCSLHALLAGHSPLRETSDVAKVVAGGTTDIAPEISPDIAALIQHATQGARDKRHATAEEFAHAVTALLARRSLPDGKHALSKLMRESTSLDLIREEPLVGAFDGLILLPVPGSEETHTYTATERSGPVTAETPQRISTTVVAPPPLRAPHEAVVDQPPSAPHSSPEPVHPMGPLLATVPRAQVRGPEATASSRTVGVVLGFSLLLVAGGGVLAGTHYLSPTQGSRPAVSVSAPPSAATAAASASSVVARESVDVATAMPTSSVPVARPTTPAPLQERPKGSSSAASSAGTTSPSKSADKAVEVTEFGVLAVSAPSDDRDAQILVDSTPHGVAPKQISLPVGTHTVTLRRSDGRSVQPRTVTVLASHTSRAPLRVPAPE